MRTYSGQFTILGSCQSCINLPSRLFQYLHHHQPGCVGGTKQHGYGPPRHSRTQPGTTPIHDWLVVYIVYSSIQQTIFYHFAARSCPKGWCKASLLWHPYYTAVCSFLLAPLDSSSSGCKRRRRSWIGCLLYSKKSRLQQ